jgi:hypothetical protein
MRRSRFWLAVALSIIVLSPNAVRACPMCSEAVTATSGAEETDAMREARAYNNSVYLMAGVPYLMLGSFSFWVYRGIRRKAIAELLMEQNLTEEPRP